MSVNISESDPDDMPELMPEGYTSADVLREPDIINISLRLPPIAVCERFNHILEGKVEAMPLDITEALYRLEMNVGGHSFLKALHTQVCATWKESEKSILSEKKASERYRRYLAIYRVLIWNAGLKTEEDQNSLRIQDLFSGVGSKGELISQMVGMLLSDNGV